MGKIRVGNKQNSGLNGEWAGHVRGWLKQATSGLRRLVDKRVISEELKELKVCPECRGECGHQEAVCCGDRINGECCTVPIIYSVPCQRCEGVGTI
jgi:hypothetical protein